MTAVVLLLLAQARRVDPGVPLTLQFLFAPSIAAELKLAEKQKTDLADLAKKWRDDPDASSALRSEKTVKGALAALAKVEKDAWDVLDKTQAARLRQLLLQHKRAALRRERDLFSLPEVVEGLALTEAQKKDQAAILAGRQKALRAVFLAGGSANDINEITARHNHETMERLLAVLDKGQKAKLEALFGARFEAMPETKPFTPPRYPGNPFTQPRWLLLEGQPAFASPVLHKELGLDASQARRLSALQFRREGRRQTEAEAATLSRRLSFLTEAQRKRLGEVILQQYDKGGTAFASSTLPRLIEVKTGLGLLPMQEEKLKARRKGKLEDVLTDAQKARWKAMLGRPTDIDLSAVARSMPVELVLLRDDRAANDLALTPEQRKNLAALAEEFTSRREWGKGKAPDRAASVAVAMKLLDAKQTKRFGELMLQREREKGLPSFLELPAVKGAIKLDPEQTGKFTKLHSGLVEVSHMAGREFGDEADEVKEALRSAWDSRMEEVLTKAQRAALAVLLGKPLK